MWLSLLCCCAVGSTGKTVFRFKRYLGGAAAGVCCRQPAGARGRLHCRVVDCQPESHGLADGRVDAGVLMAAQHQRFRITEQVMPCASEPSSGADGAAYCLTR